MISGLDLFIVALRLMNICACASFGWLQFRFVPLPQIVPPCNILLFAPIGISAMKLVTLTFDGMHLSKFPSALTNCRSHHFEIGYLFGKNA
jgi:hypothetical protein